MLKLGRSLLIFYIGINYAYEQLGLEVENAKWALLISLLIFTQILIMLNENKINFKTNVEDE